MSYKTSLYCSDNCRKQARKVSSNKYNEKFKKTINFEKLKDKIDGELWEKIDDYNYYISNKGRVFGKNGLMKASENYKNGYLYITLCKNGEHKSFNIHRLIALKFIKNPYPEKYDCVDHIDRNRKNNSIENLRWCDAQMNSQNSANVLNRGPSLWIDKCEKKGQIYSYWRVQYYENNEKKRKRFKSEEDAQKFISQL